MNDEYRVDRAPTVIRRADLALVLACLIAVAALFVVITSIAPIAAARTSSLALTPGTLPKHNPVAPGSALAQVLHRIKPDGTVPTSAALQAFALAIAPLPGVKAPSGPAGTIRGGGSIVRWVRGRWNDLTAAQRAAVQKALTGTPVTSAGGPGRLAPTKGANVTTVVTEMLARYEGPLGALPIPYHVLYLSETPKDAPAGTLAIAEPVNASGGYTGTAAACNIKITPLGASFTGSDFEVTIAHELFHCYQAVWLGLDRYNTTGSNWADEGSAEWAAYNVVPDPPTASTNSWPNYINSASSQLFGRWYDAVGFFGQAAQTGLDLWPLFPKFFQASGNVNRYHVIADAAGDKFLDNWGPGYWMNADLGSAWRIEGKAVPAAKKDPGAFTSSPTNVSVANSAHVAVQAAPYTVGLYYAKPSADVTEVQIVGHARLADEQGFDSTELSDVYLCTKSSGKCTCPDDNDSSGGSNGLPASIQEVHGRLTFGLTGATDGAKGNVLGLSLDDWCKKRSKTKATSACKVLDVKSIDNITGLHITNVKDNGDSCVFADPSAPVSAVLQNFAKAMTQGLTGTAVTPSTGAGVIVRLQDLPPGPDPKVSDYLDQIPAGLCDTPQLIDGINGASAICQGVEDIAVVGNGKFVLIVYLASGTGATHEQGAQLGRSANARL